MNKTVFCSTCSRKPGIGRKNGVLFIVCETCDKSTPVEDLISAYHKQKRMELREQFGAKDIDEVTGTKDEKFTADEILVLSNWTLKAEIDSS